MLWWCFRSLRNRRVARIWKKEGEGLFWKSEKTANDLDTNFHCSWIRITRSVRFILKIETEILAKIGNLVAFSAQKQVISKKKVFTKIETDFQANIGNSNAFSGRITTSTSQLRLPISFGGGCFHFFHQKSASKAPKNVQFCILYRPMRRLEPPAPLATLLLRNRIFVYAPWRSWCAHLGLFLIS